ncbi:MAG: hypothetical protein M4D80_15430 [Myxococcota bacterium]|nr:hypothetical protein [Deltaproteobacteria bacterium]MDQ3336558.1 hypothetical protein [Myxococcota bacterium]
MYRLVLCLLASSSVAQADPPEPTPDPPPTTEPTPTPPPPDPEVSPRQVEQAVSGDTSASVDGAPKPGDESGRTDRIDTGDGTGRQIGRGLLWVVRLPYEIVMLPVRGTIYLGEKYQAVRTLTDVFTTSDRKIEVYPMALIATGFGLNVGVRGVAKDLLDHDERLLVYAGFGGEYLWTAAAGVDSGRLLPGPVNVTLTGELASRERERFFGYGNSDKREESGMLVDPLGDQTGVASRYRIKVARVAARVRVRLPVQVEISATAAIAEKRYAADSPSTSDPDLDEVYDAAMLPGFLEGTQFLYHELEIARDTRGRADRWDAPGMRGTGSLVLAYAGRQHALDDGLNFYRYGVDLQQYVRLASGPRALQLRLWAEGVSGARGAVPFTELPRLGGEYVLRGYNLDRFRDRLAAVVQAQYTWAAATWLAPAIFVDAGRVFSGYDDLSLEDPRVGYGGMLEFMNRRGLVVRAQLGSSIDRGVFAFVSLHPAYDARTRAERY